MKFLISLFLTTLLLANTLAYGQAWQGKWITAAAAKNTPNEWLAFTTDVPVAQVPAQARLRIAADSKYWLWVNDQLVVFEGGLKRGPTPQDTYYDEVDVAKFLRKGANKLYFQLWYFGKDGFSHKSSGKAGLLVDGQIAGQPVASGAAWRVAPLPAFGTAPAPQPNERISEASLVYDARLGAQPLAWQPAQEAGVAGAAPWNQLVRRPIPQWKDFGLQPYLNAANYERRGDTIRCQLPYNAQITPYLRVKATAGQRIVMVTDNYVYFNGSSVNVRGEYITKDGEQEYESPGWLNGHWVYYVVPAGVQVLELKYRETGYHSEFAGSFTSSDPFLNRLWQKAQRTLYLTMRDSYMDCPDRERAQWTGDAVLESEESFYALDTQSHAMASKWLHELVGWQRADNSLYSPVPAGNWDQELPDQILATVGYYGAWTYYLHTGDRQTLADLYPHIQRYLALWEKRPDGLMAIRKGGWLWGDWGDNKDMLPLFNAWYYLALKGNYLMAKELGLTADAARHEQAMRALAAAFNQKFWNGKSYRDPAYTGLTDDRVQALAVVSGLADAAKYPALLPVFQQEMHASPYMEKYVYEALYRMNYPREANTRLEKRFAEMVNNDYFTTLFEGWGIGKNGFGGGTVNHAWSGGGLTILSSRLCGVRPLTPGYGRFLVAPQPGRVASASATLACVKGKIVAGFKSEATRFVLHVTVPAGTTAQVQLPGPYRTVQLNGRPHQGKLELKPGTWEVVARK
jgi:hypothetical protein